MCDVLQGTKSKEQLESWLLKEMDSCISNIFLNEDQNTFTQLFNLILYENVDGMTITADLCSYLLKTVSVAHVYECVSEYVRM